VGLAWGDVATWVAAVGTVGTLGAALGQIEIERRRRARQEQEDRRERHRSQARLIAGWAGPGEPEYGGSGLGATPIYMLNSSREPVYNVVATIVLVQGAAPPTGEEWQRLFTQRQQQDPTDWMRVPTTTATILPPGRWRVWIPGSSWTGLMAGRAGAEVAFTDSGGSHWVRRGTGELEELELPPFQHFGLHGPYDLVTPEPAEDLPPPEMPRAP
jgi:hypothetical protein